MQHGYYVDLFSKPIKKSPQKRDNKRSQENIFGCLLQVFARKISDESSELGLTESQVIRIVRIFFIYLFLEECAAKRVTRE